MARVLTQRVQAETRSGSNLVVWATVKGDGHPKNEGQRERKKKIATERERDESQNKREERVRGRTLFQAVRARALIYAQVLLWRRRTWGDWSPRAPYECRNRREYSAFISAHLCRLWLHKRRVSDSHGPWVWSLSATLAIFLLAK